MAESLLDHRVRFRPDADEYLRSALGGERLDAIARALPRPPLQTCVRVNTLALAVPEAAERLRAATGHEVAAHPLLPDALLLGPRPREDVDVPQYDPQLPEVVLGRLCGEAVLRGSLAYVKGVLACSPGVRHGDVVQLSVDLETAPVTRGSRVADYPGRRLFLGLGVAQLGRAQLFNTESGVGVVPGPLVTGAALPSLNGVLEGLVFPQNLPSLMVAHVLAPQPGEAVLDMCAAPGGKTTHLAQLMRGEGLLVACDRSRSKTKGIRDVCARHGAGGLVAAVKLDSAHMLQPDCAEDARAVVAAARERCSAGVLTGVAGFAPASFDRVLLDPPCSSLGLRPRLLHPQTAAELADVAEYQRRFVECAARLVRPGGILVYSTCTFSPHENEANVAFALGLGLGLQLVPAEPRLGQPGLPGHGLTDEQCAMVQRFDPGVVSGVDSIGFFCAKMVRAS